MAKKEQVPAIRFQGFADPWEQRKLEEFVSFFSGLTYSPKDIRPSGTLVLRSSNVKDGEIIDADNVYVDSEIVNSENVRDGDIIVVVRNGSRALIGKHAEIKGFKPNTVIGAFMTGIRSEHPSFVNALLNTPHFDDEVEMNMGATINQITGYMFSKMEFLIPSADEQDAIGEYFRKLDDLITLHQRKYDKLVAIKRSMLEKMFPREGSRFPEIRFAGFTDPWEQRKLSEVVGVYDGVHQTPHYTDSGVMFLSVENIATLTSQKFISEEAFERDYRVYPQKGDVLMTRIGDVGTPNVVETSEKLAFYVSLALLKPIEIDSYFLCNAIQSPRFKKGLKDRTLVTAIPQKINKDEIGKVDILMPESASEQAQIGTYFHQLDTLITLHQRKLEKLQAIKRSMLEKMFV
nr:restriction endonuclease subunit S [Clostridia bacterium]